jgi:hypothetical protein
MSGGDCGLGREMEMETDSGEGRKERKKERKFQNLGVNLSCG